MNDNKSNASSGVGFAGLLTIVFIALKLIGVITWGWAWVLSPLWISAILWALLISMAIAVSLSKK